MMLFLSIAVAANHQRSSPPNIIMALGDDTGWHGVGWHQSAACQADPLCAMQTPVMDALVREGIELDQHYTYRFCSPTRAALMTGRLPIHVNQENNAEFPWTAAAMHFNFTTVADVLRGKAGYSTHQFGTCFAFCFWALISNPVPRHTALQHSAAAASNPFLQITYKQIKSAALYSYIFSVAVTSPCPAHPHDSHSTSGVRLHIPSLAAARVVVLRQHMPL